MTRRVAIVAKGGTAANAPFGDPSWEIWGLSQITYPRMDLCFECHTADFLEKAFKREETQLWRTHLEINRSAKQAVTYPGNFHYFDNPVDIRIDEMLELTGGYLESSIAYMVAWAIMEEVDEVELFGVHMALTVEYFDQLANLEYLIGLARPKMKIYPTPGAPLLMSIWEAGRYGVSYKKRFGKQSG